MLIFGPVFGRLLSLFQTKKPLVFLYLITLILFISPFVARSFLPQTLPQAFLSQNLESKKPAPTPNLTPVKVLELPPPALSAQAVMVIDTATQTTLFESQPHLKLYPASTTKIMTGLIALENLSPDQLVTISEEDNSIGQSMKLIQGEQLTVRDLLYGTLVGSGNDAALALAQAYEGGYPAFVELMNQKASKLELNNTHFTNVSGLENPNHYTSAHDLALLTLHALQNQEFAHYVSMKKITVTSLDGQIDHPLYNTNLLLGTLEGVEGVKTGWTQAAGDCLVTSVNRNGRRIITVVLGSQDRFADSRQLIEWIYQVYDWPQSVS